MSLPRLPHIFQPRPLEFVSDVVNECIEAQNLSSNMTFSFLPLFLSQRSPMPGSRRTRRNSSSGSASTGSTYTTLSRWTLKLRHTWCTATLTPVSYDVSQWPRRRLFRVKFRSSWQRNAQTKAEQLEMRAPTEKTPDSGVKRRPERWH